MRAPRMRSTTIPAPITMRKLRATPGAARSHGLISICSLEFAPCPEIRLSALASAHAGSGSAIMAQREEGSELRAVLLYAERQRHARDRRRRSGRRYQNVK